MVTVPAPNKYPVFIPQDPATSSFGVVTPELWAHRELPIEDDDEDGIVHVCTNNSSTITASPKANRTARTHAARTRERRE